MFKKQSPQGFKKTDKKIRLKNEKRRLWQLNFSLNPDVIFFSLQLRDEFNYLHSEERL